MVKRNIIYIGSKSDAGYCAEAEMAVSGARSYVTPSVEQGKKPLYVHFPGLVSALAKAPRELYEIGVSLKFDAKAREKMSPAERESLSSLVNRFWDDSSDLAGYADLVNLVAATAEKIKR